MLEQVLVSRKGQYLPSPCLQNSILVIYTLIWTKIARVEGAIWVTPADRIHDGLLFVCVLVYCIFDEQWSRAI